MSKAERVQRIDAALEKLRASELSHKLIAKRYLNLESQVNKQLGTKNGEDSVAPRQTHSRLTVKQSSSSFSKMAISGISSTTLGSVKSKKDSQHRLLQKRIFLFHDDLDAINDINSKRNSRIRLFMNALETTNLDVWKSNAIKYPVRKLEAHMELN